MRKIISLVLVFVLVCSLSVTTAFADNWKDESGNKFPPGLSKWGGLPPGIAKKVFDDIDDFSWAKKAIEKMALKGLIKGDGNGLFRPGYSVSKLEAVIMALRVMGWEDEAKDIDRLPRKFKKKEIDDWAVGYITLAYDKGILDDVDMMYFNPKEPVKRHEVAKYVIRALGYEDEAQDHMDEELPFIDAEAVPVGSVGYVYLVNDMGLMEGDDQKRFNPMGTMTRAEMAVLFARLDDKVDSDVDNREVIGEIYRIHDETIALKVRGDIKLFKVDEKVRVYDGRERIDYDDLKPGTKVVMELQDNEVIYIEVLDKEDEDKIISRYSGVVKDIKTNRTRGIAIQAETMMLIFEVIDDVEVEFENGEGSFDEIEIGDEVSILVDTKNRAREIYVHREREHTGWDGEVEGVITEIDLVGIYHISIDNREYDLDEDAEVTVDGEEAELDDLEVGMEVEAEVEDDIVVKIKAESKEVEEVKGIIEKLDLVGTYHITIDDEVYRLDKDAEVTVDGEEAELDDLEVGMEVEAEVKDDIVVKIEAESKEVEEVKGIIERLDLVGTYHMTIDGEEYELDKEAEVEIEDEEAQLDDLEIGMEVEAKLENNIIIKIDAENTETEFEGEIITITKTSEGTKLTIKNEDNNKINEYLISEDVEIDIEDVRNPGIEDLKVGQEGEFKVVNNLIIKIEIDD
jgi:hypothetical protein